MLFWRTLSLLATSAILGALSPAQAAPIFSPLPENAYISIDDLDWAWANPVPATHPEPGLFLGFQASYRWRIPTSAELDHAPAATRFIFPGANVPLDARDPISGAFFQATNAALTGAAACATPYFSTINTFCDWQDGLGQLLGPWAGLPGAFDHADQLVVREARGPDPFLTPEPTTLLLVGTTMAGLGLARLRRWRRKQL